ncbi:MAG: ATP-binding protein [Candidatus Dormibacteria bacterium]
MPGAHTIGHARVAGRLGAAAREDNLSHALLIAGPPSVGKTTVALALAKLLLDCSSWPGPCTGHPDLWLEDGDAERIGIDRLRSGGGERQERTLQDFLALHSYVGGGSRVAIIARAERLTVEAANCILRTVEEPPPRTHIVLCTPHPERLPETIVSRCQSLVLAPVARPEIATWLVSGHGVGADLAETAALLSGGRPGRALRLATHQDILQEEMNALNRFLAVAGQGTVAAIQAADGLAPPTSAEGRERSLVQLAVWSEFIRDAICHAEGTDELSTWAAYRPAVAAWARLPVWRLVDMLAGCVRAADELERNANSRLCYEVLFLDIFGPPGPQPPALTGWTPPAVPGVGASVPRGAPPRNPE